MQIRTVGIGVLVLALSIGIGPLDVRAQSRRSGEASISPRARTAAHDLKVVQHDLGYRSSALKQLARQSEQTRNVLFRVEVADDGPTSDVAVGQLEAHVAKLRTLYGQTVVESRARSDVRARLDLVGPRLDLLDAEVEAIAAEPDPRVRAKSAREARERLAAADPRGPGYRLYGPTVLLLDPDARPPGSRGRAVLKEGTGEVVRVPARGGR